MKVIVVMSGEIRDKDLHILEDPDATRDYILTGNADLDVLAVQDLSGQSLY